MGLINFFRKPQEVVEERSYITSLSAPIFGSSNKVNNQYMQIPSFARAHNLIVSSIASLPIYLYQENENGDIKRVHGDIREKLLNEEPNSFQTSYNFKEKFVSDLLLKGEGLALINRKGLNIEDLHNVNIFSIKNYADEKGVIVDKIVSYTLNNKTNDSSYHNFIHAQYLQGLNNQSNTLNEILEEYKALNSLTENTSSPKGVLSTEGRLNEEAIKKLRESWNNLYSGRKNAGKTIILENGLKYSPISSTDISSIDFDQIEKSITKKIAKLFNIPYSILSDESKLEDNHLFLAQLNGLLKSIEESLDISLLTEREKNNGLFFAFEIGEIQKSSEKEKIENLIQLLNGGIISLNEARAKLNLDYVNRDYKKISLGEALHYEDNGEIFVVNLGESLNTDGRVADTEEEKVLN